MFPYQSQWYRVGLPTQTDASLLWRSQCCKPCLPLPLCCMNRNGEPFYYLQHCLSACNLEARRLEGTHLGAGEKAGRSQTGRDGEKIITPSLSSLCCRIPLEAGLLVVLSIPPVSCCNSVDLRGKLEPGCRLGDAITQLSLSRWEW